VLIDAGRRRIYCDLVGGEDRPVVCLAHALSADGGIWADQLPALLAAGWRVLRLDMRGHGGSDATPGEYTVSELAADVVLALDALAIERVHFAGLSIGGMIGQTLGLDHPERLRSLLLCDTAPTNIPGGREVWETRFAAIDRAGSVEPLADATMERWFTPAFRVRRPGRWEQIRATVAGTTLAGYEGGGAAIRDFDCVDRLPAIRVPSFVVWGDHDPGTPPEGNRLIASRIPGARSHEIANARHVPIVEYPELFNALMLEWLRAVG
jgi:3-oxoadipate enol-lactonase